MGAPTQVQRRELVVPGEKGVAVIVRERHPRVVLFPSALRVLQSEIVRPSATGSPYGKARTYRNGVYAGWQCFVPDAWKTAKSQKGKTGELLFSPRCFLNTGIEVGIHLLTWNTLGRVPVGDRTANIATTAELVASCSDMSSNVAYHRIITDHVEKNKTDTDALPSRCVECNYRMVHRWPSNGISIDPKNEVDRHLLEDDFPDLGSAIYVAKGEDGRRKCGEALELFADCQRRRHREEMGVNLQRNHFSWQVLMRETQVLKLVPLFAYVPPKRHRQRLPRN